MLISGGSIGDKELSQAFIARATTLLKPDGDCGLLVSAGVLLKRHSKSREFRARWLVENTIQTVINFSHVREVFFSGAISPFCYVHFKLGKADYSHKINYWSAKRTKPVDQIQSVVLSLPDLHRVRQHEFLNNELLWKVYWWGSHRDAAFIKALNTEENLGKLAEDRGWTTGQGYILGTDRIYAWTTSVRELPIKYFKKHPNIFKNIVRIQSL